MLAGSLSQEDEDAVLAELEAITNVRFTFNMQMRQWHESGAVLLTLLLLSVS